ncbi:MAG: bacteriophage holin [Xanthobacteraceae bacterium]|uniref:bacteriophage holin n=1 Tax=Pseudolabrys sp. TaxID=1960880 RepID=UPI003D151E27
MSQLQPFPFGVAVGVVWGVGILFAGLMAMTGYGAVFVNALGTVYIGYSASIVGAIIGTVWALVDGFVAGALIAWVYNRVAS